MAIGSPQWMYKSGEAYQIDQSLKFEGNDSAYLKKTFTSAGNRRTWTWSAWVKRSNSSATHMLFFTAVAGDLTEDDHFGIRLDSGTSSNIILTWGNGNTAVTNAIFRDPSAWMHIVVAIDTTQGTSTNRVKVYVNGTQQTFSSTDLPSQNHQYGINKAQEHNIGSRVVYGSSGNYYSGYMAEVNFVDGQALTPSDFGTTGTYGEWNPKEYSGTYGTNGFYLPFKGDYQVEGFNVVKYKGNSLDDNYIGGIGFKPDITWLAPISLADHNMIYDRVRGYSHQFKTNAGESEAFTNKLLPTTDGIYLTTTDQNQNSSSHTYVTWNWDMGSDTPTGFACVMTKGNADRRTITDIGFSPDLVINDTLSANQNTFVYDRIRGPGKELRTNSSNAEGTNDGVLSFTKDGFRRGSSNDCNENGVDYVDWCWYMGNTSVTNTDGSLTSTVMASTTYGQSIVKYTGNTASSATVGHGLNSAPEFMIVRTTAANAWAVYHASIGNTHLLEINTTAGKADNNEFWNDTSPTNSVFTIGSHNEVNHTQDYMAYCFHSVSGYSKFGTYSGDGTTNGSKTVNLGFRPAWVMIKCTNDSESWWVWDNVMNPFTNTQRRTALNSSGTQVTNVSTSADNIQFTSTGFKMTGLGGGSNQNGNTYVYAAFAGGQDSISTFNTDGEYESRTKVNSTYKQGIATYHATDGGGDVGHGLGETPEVILVKRRNSTGNWVMYHHAINGSNKQLYLNATNAKDSVNISSIGSSTFYLSGWSDVANAGDDYLSYFWKGVDGYSKFGGYTGNGSSSGATVTLGFRAAFIMIKCASHTSDWRIWDNVRNNTTDGTNSSRHILANENVVENATLDIRFTDTGFIPKSADGEINGSGKEYIYMAFADKREYAYWLDQSGNNNDWLANNITESAISVDSPTNNFCTWNPVSNSAGGLATLSEGNLRYNPNGTASASGMFGTIAVDSGKWYFEVYRKTAGNGYHTGIAGYSGATRKDYHVYAGQYYYGDNNTTMGWASPGANTEIISCAFDLDNNKIWFARNNVWKNDGDPAAGTGQTDTLTSDLKSVSAYTKHPNASYSGDDIHNFGQDSSFASHRIAQGYQDSNEIGDFYYQPPTGFLALCTKNLPDVAVKPQEHFNSVLYTGNGGNKTISGYDFQPDMVWGKARDQAYNNHIHDAVRGVEKRLAPNTTDQEYSDGALKTFTSDGYTFDTAGAINVNGTSYVNWSWKANGSGSSNTDGSITSTVSANVDAGFSIVSFTGDGSNTTIGHGLSKAPEIVITKGRNFTDAWHTQVYPAIAATKTLLLNTTGGESTSNAFNNTAPTSSVFSISTGYGSSGRNLIAYCFHSVDGYSKVGTYTGNGNTDGTFVYTGFRPAYVQWKKSSGSGTIWQTFGYVGQAGSSQIINPLDRYVSSNSGGAEGDYDFVDFVSNGFKHRHTSGHANGSGDTYIYIAFAETPFKYSNAR